MCREELLKRALQATWDVLTSTEQPISTQIDQKVSYWSSADSELASLAFPPFFLIAYLVHGLSWCSVKRKVIADVQHPRAYINNQ